MRRITWMAMAGLGLGLALAGCNQDLSFLNSGAASSGGDGSLRLLITDKPYPFDMLASAKITITRVEVRRADDGDPNDPNDVDVNEGPDDDDRGLRDAGGTFEPGDDDQTGQSAPTGGVSDVGDPIEEPSDDGDDSADHGDEDEHDGGFVTIFEGEKCFDLLQLRNGRADLLAEADIPAGQYDQMRLIVTEGVVTLINGREFLLSVPSGAQSGIKLHFDFEVVEGEETTLILDVDLSRAFKAIPSGHIDDPALIREFKFHPSLAMKLIDLLDAGSIAGTVSDADGDPIAGASVTAFDADGEVTTTSTDADGAYVLRGLVTAVYSVEASASGFADASLDDVEVTAGEQSADNDFALDPDAP